jgi:putative MATE family efflux protein
LSDLPPTEPPAPSIAASARRLAWPILLSQIIFTVPTLYDAVWLGRLGGSAQAAAGLVMTVRITMISPLMALSLAGGAVVARSLGAGRQGDADLAASQATLLMVLSSGFIGIIGLALTRPLMALAGADPSVMPYAVRYARVIFAGLIAMELVPSLGYMLSGAGEPRLMLVMATVTAVTLIVFEPSLTARFGISGAGIALVGSYAVGALLGLVILASGRAAVRLSMRGLRPDRAMMGRILRIALPAVPQRGAQNLAVSAITRLVAGFGAPTLAAWAIVQRLYTFTVIPGFALSRTVPAMVGRNLGSGRPDLAARSVSFIARVAAATNTILFGLAALVAPLVMTLFTNDASVADISVRLTRVLAAGFVARALAMVYEGAQSGAGDTISPMIINLVALWVVQVPAAILLSQTARLGPSGVWIALVGSWVVQVLLMAARYRQGHWRRQPV